MYQTDLIVTYEVFCDLFICFVFFVTVYNFFIYICICTYINFVCFGIFLLLHLNKCVHTCTYYIVFFLALTFKLFDNDFCKTVTERRI